MNVDFVRFKAADSVELQGWLSNVDSDTAVVHIHGMSGNGYENAFLDNLRELYSNKGISFFTIDTRGRGIISSFWKDDTKSPSGKSALQAGSCFEIFDESAYDIQGAIDYLKSLGKMKFILQGHSLGCTKVVNYYVTNEAADIEKVILLAPTDMVGWAKTDPHHEKYMQRAAQLNSEGRGFELVAAQCWLDKTPLSAQTYPTICAAGSSADIYGSRDSGALLGRISQPMLIAYGTADIGITEIDGTIDNWQKRVAPIKHEKTSISIVDGASHGFKGYETVLSESIGKFLEQYAPNQ